MFFLDIKDWIPVRGTSHYVPGGTGASGHGVKSFLAGHVKPFYRITRTPRGPVMA